MFYMKLIVSIVPCSFDLETGKKDSFVNSQEWTLSRSVPDLRLGIVGSLSSGKSALVHRYLTGSYLQDESPEGGRFKKEVVIDGQSYLLLIRDEGGPPEIQVDQWMGHIVSSTRKWHRYAMVGIHVVRYRNSGDAFLRRIVVIDKMWART
ncbi:centaurin-gamma-1A [Trichonephila clavipes]|nr:centaurin-gamma-1A [Trichonephila clavipes]